MGILARVEDYRYEVVSEDMGTCVTFMIPLSQCLTEAGANTYLKVRPVTRARIDHWKKEFRSIGHGFLRTQAFCCKRRTSTCASNEL